MSQGQDAPAAVGVVVIGRNEGERLSRCLGSLLGSVDRLAYVDSGSSDGSVAMARGLGVEVVELDMSSPFTAARARNTGLERLLQLRPDMKQVFFVDGDCEVAEGWIDEAARFLESHADVAVVWGRRRERHPDRSVYNLLCDIEWNSAPPGETMACGGDAIMRVAALREAHGYREDLICGEEPELCARMRTAGWRVWHIDRDMTVHDAAMYRFGQWWKRAVRVGYGYAMFMRLESVRGDRQWVYRSRRAWIWGCWIPLTILFLTLAFGWTALVLAAVYPMQVLRLALQGRSSARENWSRAAAMVLGKFAETQGQLKFILEKGRGVRSGIIEYK
jgi:glycosyltransferase involved in cell wall biosynthesis